MKILKKIALVLGILILIILVAGLFMKKEFTVKRSVEIDKPVAEVYDYVKYLKNQDEYSVWLKMDPKTKKIHKGTDGTVGFISGWNSKHENVGVGEQEIIKMITNERIDYDMRFKEPMKSEAKASMVFKNTGEFCTHVEWSFDGNMGYPYNVMLPFMGFEESLGPQLQEGLDNLKGILDKE
jgi:uncharacterized membrane protein